MKKFFKILGKIIKILLKIILWLILGIIIIVAIGLVIINNRTLKFYENDYGDMRFTMNKNFKVEYGYEIKLSLNEGSFLFNDIYDSEVDIMVNIFDISLKNLSAKFKLFEDTYIEGFMKVNIPNKSFIKNLRENGDNFLDILQYCFDGNFTEYHDNGQIARKGQTINGLENGYYVSYYENGQIRGEGNYKNGEFDGDWTLYYNNGNINYKSENGYGINFYKNGNIYNEGIYINGYINGTLTGYYENGDIKYIYNYNNGKLDGKSVIYNEDGCYENIEADNGTGIRTIYDENNNIILKYGFITDEENNLLLNGKFIRYFENGKITEGNYINGKRNLSRTGYYEDGSIRFLGNFENGLGIMSYYDENGNLIGTGEEFFDGYESYTKNGLNISLYENGQIASMCNYLDGVKNGKCTTYYENGQIMEIGEYKNKKNQMLDIMGKRSYYDENGNLIGTGETTCFTENENGLCVERNTTGYNFRYYPSYNIQTINYIDGVIQYTTGYYENGNIEYIEINDFNKRPTRIFRLDYYNNGQIKYEINYNDGKRNGERIEYFEDGSISEKGNYIDGKPDGYRVEYFEDGTIYSEGNYDNGKRVGTRNWYLGDGSIGFSKNYDE